MFHKLASWSLSAVGALLILASPGIAQQINDVPRIHPNDPHRFTMGGQTWYPAGYYPSIGALTTDQNDYTNYYRNLIDKLSANGINYFRITFTMGQPYGNSINPYQRTGPGNAADGRPRFDLTKFDQSYFNYWLNVVTYARSKGIVIQLCILDVWHTKSLVAEDNGPQHVWGLQYDYYYGTNNINGLNTVDHTAWMTTTDPVYAYHQAMVRKLVDTIGSQPNLVWEMANESGRTDWENALGDYLTSYEQSKGMATHLVMPRDLPGHQYVPDYPGNANNDPVSTHSGLVNVFGQNKIMISDNDGAQDIDPPTRRRKAWGCLTAGAHMDYFHFDMYQQAVLDSTDAADGMRFVGYLRKFLSTFQVNLIGMQPSDGLLSRGWCTARSGQEYVIYLDGGGSTTVSGLPGSFTATWFNPRTGTSSAASGGPTFNAPDGNDWALYIRSGGTPPPPPPPPSGQTPYGGSPRAIPGTIEAEHFDEGGEGVAYHDVDGANQGGAFRATGVDLQDANDTGGGYTVGWTQAGEWLEYTVNVAAAGTYTLDVRLASQGQGGSFRILFDGVDKTGMISVPDTGGWLSWRTIAKTGVSLSAGTQVLRISLDNIGPSGDVGNINWVRFTATSAPPPPPPPPPPSGQTPYGGTARAVPGTIEAEHFDEGGEGVAYHDVDGANQGGNFRATGVDLDQANDAGGGYAVGWTQAGEWLEYTVNVAAAGTYTVEVRVASQGQGGTFRLLFGGADKTGSMTVPDTGGWYSWQTLTRTGVSLSAGVQILRINLDTTGSSGDMGNINWIRFTAASAPPPPPPPPSGQTPYGGTAATIPGRIEAERFDEGGEGIAYHDADAANQGGQFRSTGVDLDSDGSGGTVVGWTQAGEWLEYTVNVTASGTWRLRIRVASDGQGGTFHVEIDGSNRTGSLTVPNTGGWYAWQEIEVPGIALSAGTHVLRIYMESIGPSGDMGNIDWLDFAPPGAKASALDSETAAPGAGGCGLTGLDAVLLLLALRRLRRRS
jgi:hypothetical protein